ncbi:hypothetical protein D9M70_440790 [compost metagenome]
MGQRRGDDTRSRTANGGDDRMNSALVATDTRRMGRDHLDQRSALERLLQPVVAVQPKQRPHQFVGQNLRNDHHRNVAMTGTKRKNLRATEHVAAVDIEHDQIELRRVEPSRLAKSA